MKFILYLFKRIIILFAALLVPVAIVLVCYNITVMDIPVFNVGIRSILNIAINQLSSIIFTSYIFATIFSIVLIDKTKINNLFSLHIPPLIITLLILLSFFMISENGKFFITSDNNVQIEFNTFLKQAVFNNLNKNVIYVNHQNKKLTAFTYNKTKNIVIPLRKISYSDDKLIMTPKNSNLSSKIINLKLSKISKMDNFFNNKLIKIYTSKLKTFLKNSRVLYSKLNKRNEFIFLSSLILSFIIFIVPLSFLLNDGVWGVTGLIGIVLILLILPPFYNFIFKIGYKCQHIFSFLGSFNYLVYSIIFFIIGILMDLLIKFFKKAEV